MFRAEESEILLADPAGVSSFVAKVENFLAPNHVSRFEETVVVQKSSDGARFV